MKLLFLFLLLLSAAGSAARAEPPLARFFTGYDGAFVMLDVRSGRYTRYNAARCRERFSPCSTFKIPNSLIGLETGVIPDPDHRMRWDGRKHPIEAWNRDHTLRTAFENSAIWYYQALAERVGPERMARHVRALRYGNEDTSGGITRFWLDSTLRISAEEQVGFLHRLYRGDLPVSRRSLDQVREMMLAARTERGILRGKTGTGGDPVAGIATLGWYVGWVEQGDRAFIFAANISGGENPSGRTARRIAEEILKSRGLLNG